MMAGLSAGRVSASSYDARHTVKNLTGVNGEYESSNIVRSGRCFVGAETFTAHSNTERSQTLTSVTYRSGTSVKTKISRSPTLKIITGVSIDLERLFNG